jgi:Raf kinase inhibitor-like YbhB/YbcL family protein
MVSIMKELRIKSSAFEHNGSIPEKYTCDGEDVNPPLTIEGIPEGTQSLALIMDDPDAPMGTWDHWVVWNMPSASKEIRENSVPGVEGMNDFRKHSYGGPCPPRGTHRYSFKVYALDTKLNIGASSRKKDLEKAMQGHILAKGELIGRYSRR